MPLSAYGVLPALAVACRREGSSDAPHYQIHVVDDDGTDYRIAVNVKSQQSPSELLYLVDDDFSHPATTAAGGLDSSWHPLPMHAVTGAESEHEPGQQRRVHSRRRGVAGRRSAPALPG